MRIKTYEAHTMQEVLRQIKQDLGPDALILNTRTIAKQGRWFDLRKRRMIEVIAGIGTRKPKPDASTPPTPISSPVQNVRNALDDIYQQMLDSEINKELSQRIIYMLDDIITYSLARDKKLEVAQVKKEFAERLSQIIPISGGVDFNHNEKQQIVALVGPTVVGKTTTIAKLAAVASVLNRCKVGLISIDAYRIAAYEQLKTYAEIIGLPVELALSPQGAQDAINTYTDRDMIFVDTVGRSPNHQIHMAELRSYIQAIRPTEVHLTLSATVKFEDLVRIVDRYKELVINKTIFTKLDETVSLNTLVNGAYYTKYPLSYFSTGQDVPDDIEVANIERIAALLLPEEKLAAVVQKLNLSQIE